MSVKLISSSSKENCILAMFVALVVVVVAPSLITVCGPTLLSAYFVERGWGGRFTVTGKSSQRALVVSAYVIHTHTYTEARISDSKAISVCR